MMVVRRVAQINIAVTLAMIWTVSVLAQTQSSSPLKPDKTVGAAEVYYFKEKNKTRAQVRIYLVGKAEDTGGSREALSMDVIFEVDGMKVTRPKYVTIAFSAYAPSKSKYQSNHDLHIHTEGLEGLSDIRFNTRVLSSKQLSSGGSQEIFLTPAIEFSKFLRMSSAHLVVITLGDTHVVLRKEDITVLNDLNQTIEK